MTFKDRAKKYLDAYKKYGSMSKAAEALGMAKTTFNSHYHKASAANTSDPITKIEVLEAEKGNLQREVKRLESERVTDQRIKDWVFELAASKPQPPAWVGKASKKGRTTGWPTLMISDWHYGEVVDPDQVYGLNEYNVEIATRRFENTIDKTVDLLKNHMVKPSYPGICLALAGDLLSGTIHDELTATNEVPIMPAVVDVVSHLIKAIDYLADNFEKVFAPCVIGNHSRTTRKPASKMKAHTNFDWLIYRMVERHFSGNENISFLIPDGSDIHYSLFNTRFCLTHGDQFRGGQGFQGAMAPIARGELKKRIAANTYKMPYDILLMGHFHQLMYLSRTIVNSSIKGYDEFAVGNNFPFEIPNQALFITHPEWGVTHRMGVHS